MQLGEILAQAPGLNKRFVHYLESQGYISPIKIKKQRIARRDYAEEDLRVIRGIWDYYQRGFSVQNAFDLVRRAHLEQVYLLCKVPAGTLEKALEVLRRFDRVVETTAVYGERVDLVVKMHAPDDGDIYSVLAEAVRQEIVEAHPQVLRIERSEVGRPGEPKEGQERRARLRAYVLLKVPHKQIGGVVEQLREFPGVIEASAIYGETDIVLQALVEDQDELDDLIMNKVQAIPAIESTRTFIAVGGTYWRRESNAAKNAG